MKFRIYPILGLFLVLVFFDLKFAVPFLSDLIVGTPMVKEQSVSAASFSPTATPTPFQPVLNSPTPTLLPITTEEIAPEATLEPTSTKVPEPTPLPENPYELLGLKFDGSDPINIVLYPLSRDPVEIYFEPVIPNGGPEDYKPGNGKAGVWADDFGNIAVNPHSGCYKRSGKWVPLEGEDFREELQGGGCYDVLSRNSNSLTNERIQSLMDGTAEATQNGVTIGLRVVSAGVIAYENLDTVRSLDPVELADLIGVTLPDRSVVVVTSGWGNPSLDIWFSAERLIIVLEA